MAISKNLAMLFVTVATVGIGMLFGWGIPVQKSFITVTLSIALALIFTPIATIPYQIAVSLLEKPGWRNLARASMVSAIGGACLSPLMILMRLW